MKLHLTINSFIMTILVAILTGCADNPQPNTEITNTEITKQPSAHTEKLKKDVPEDGVYIYLFRESEFHGSLSSWPVKFNGKDIGSLRNETYILVKTNSGEKLITPESNLGIFAGKTKVYKLDAKAGKIYYLRNGIPSAFTSQVIFRQVPDDEAQRLLPTYRHLSTYSDYKPSQNLKECKYWNPKTGISDEEKAQKEVIKILDSYAKKTLENKKLIETPSFYIKDRKIPADKIVTTLQIIKKIDNGEFKSAAQDVSSEIISYMLPIAGQYKTLLDSTKMAINSVLVNWVEDLYDTQSYRWLRKRVNQEILRGAKRRDPFYPTPLLKRSSPIYNKMFKIERAIYQEWKNSRAYDEDFYTSADGKLSIFGHDSVSSKWARLRQKLGKEPLPSEIFWDFYLDIIKNQKSYIEVTFERVMEDKLYDEADDVNYMIIKNVCSSLHKK